MKWNLLAITALISGCMGAPAPVERMPPEQVINTFTYAEYDCDRVDFLNETSSPLDSVPNHLFFSGLKTVYLSFRKRCQGYIARLTTLPYRIETTVVSPRRMDIGFLFLICGKV